MTFNIGNKKIININSSRRESGTPGDFYFRIDNISIPEREGLRYTHMSVLEASIPKTWYNIRAGYNTFRLVETDTSIPIVNTFNISIQPGSYNSYSFANTIANAMTFQSGNSGLGLTYTISFSNNITTPITGRYIFTITGGTATMNVEIIPLSMNVQFGLAENESLNINQGNLFEVESTNIAFFTDIGGVFLKSDMVDEIDNILQPLTSSNTSAFSIISYQNNDPYANSKRIKHIGSNIFHFYLHDSLGRPLDLNNINLTFNILLFKANDYKERKVIQEHNSFVVGKKTF